MASYLTGVVAVLFVVNAANGLTCYSCNSKDSTSCKWGLASFTYNTQECTSAGVLDSVITPKCYKITGQNKDGKEYIARGCLPPATVGCSAISKAVGWLSSQASDEPDSLQNLSCETCETDKCNSATSLAGFTFVGVLLSAVAFAL
ncbi:unnamed protein product [Phyllotreta striolata]|uniref:Protein sleepless n=1 Tax=Phyllotreta striolata TaxID=444603 RepID=A0A9N9TKF9_PHYSR|nr:unnamed protein product [Phyllotreta striolata]